MLFVRSRDLLSLQCKESAKENNSRMARDDVISESEVVQNTSYVNETCFKVLSFVKKS